jgi:class 3 adenylate cyclase
MQTFELETRSHILAEEFRAEKLLAFTRLGIMLSVAVAHLLLVAFADVALGALVDAPVILIDAGLIVLSAAFVVDLHLLYHRFRRLYKPWYRYAIATADIALVAGLAFSFVRFQTAVPTAMPLAFLGAFAMVLLFVSTVRFDPFNSLYLGLAYAAVAWVVLDHLEPAFLVAPLVGVFVVSALVAALMAAHTRNTVRKVNQAIFLQRFLPNNFAEQVATDPTIWGIGGQERYVTVLFSDIRGFTQFSEERSPTEVIDYLNHYLDRMIEIVFQHNGTLDKFIGDALMAVFGAPLSSGRDERDAVSAACAMVRAVEEFNDDMRSRGYPPIQIGCGIAAGGVVAGNIGNARRLEYTVLGDTVNVASRLESLNKELGTQILVTERVREAVEGHFRFGRVEQLPVKGRAEPVRVAEVLDG